MSAPGSHTAAMDVILNDGHDRGPVVMIVTVIFCALSTLFVLLRLVSRIGVVRRVGKDDYAVIVAWLISIGLSTAICYGTHVGLGKHTAAIPDSDHGPLRKSEYVFSVLYNPALMATKTSICIFYLTLAQNHRSFKWLTIATLAIVNLAGLALTLLNIIQCRPFDAAFQDPTPTTAHCTDLVSLYLSSAPVNILTDLALLFLPMPILTGMRLPRNEKIILIVTFSFGAFVAVVDVVRIAYLESAATARLQTASGEASSTDGYSDFSYSAALSFMWSAIEVHTGLIVACVPGVKPLVTKYAPNLLGKMVPKGNSHASQSKHEHEKSSNTQKIDRSGSGGGGGGGGDAANDDHHQWAHFNPTFDLSGSTARSPRSPGLQRMLTTTPPPKDALTTPEGKETSGSVDLSDISDTPFRSDTSDASPMPLNKSFGAGSPPPHTTSHGNETHTSDKEMGFSEFLRAPPGDDMPDFVTSATRAKPSTITAAKKRRKSSMPFDRLRQSSIMYDFVNMKNAPSLVHMTNRESILPVVLVTILFFLWGFAYGLLAVLNGQFQAVVHLNQAQIIGLHSAYFGAYLVGPLTFGIVVLRKWGFRFTFIVGLVIYGVGTLIFWPSAVLGSFPAFVVSNLVVGLGVSTLEIASNPFIALCGPPEYAEVRLNISQGVQAIGSVVSPLLAQKVLFKSVHDADSLVDVQWAYLAICLFDFILALVFYYLPIPEATDEDFEAEAEKRRAINRQPVLSFFGSNNSSSSSSKVSGRRLFTIPVVIGTLIVGIFSQFCYVSAQEAVVTYIEPYFQTVAPHAALSPFDYSTVGHSVFAVGRFLTAGLCLVVKPRHLLMALYIGTIVASALAMSLSGNAGIAMIILIFLFESGIFSLIFAISLRGLGSATKWGSACITASIAGGAIFPGIMAAVSNHKGVQSSFCVPLALFAFGALMPLYLELNSAAKRQVDPVATVGGVGSLGGRGGVLPSSSSSRPPRPATNGEGDFITSAVGDSSDAHAEKGGMGDPTMTNLTNATTIVGSFNTTRRSLMARSRSRSKVKAKVSKGDGSGKGESSSGILARFKGKWGSPLPRPQQQQQQQQQQESERHGHRARTAGDEGTVSSTSSSEIDDVEAEQAASASDAVRVHEQTAPNTAAVSSAAQTEKEGEEQSPATTP